MSFDLVHFQEFNQSLYCNWCFVLGVNGKTDTYEAGLST
jgi:hypothetical protein